MRTLNFFCSSILPTMITSWAICTLLVKSTFQLSLIRWLVSRTTIRILSTSSNRFSRELVRKKMSNLERQWRLTLTSLRATFGRYQFLKNVSTKLLRTCFISYSARSLSALLSTDLRAQQTTLCIHTCTLTRVVMCKSVTGIKSLSWVSTSLRVCKVISMKCTSRMKKWGLENLRNSRKYTRRMLMLCVTRWRKGGEQLDRVRTLRILMPVKQTKPKHQH